MAGLSLSIRGARVINNSVNLCSSCVFTLPECKATHEDILFGDGMGKDNVCSCRFYKAVSTDRRGRWIRNLHISENGEETYIWECSECKGAMPISPVFGFMVADYCPSCGAHMIKKEVDHRQDT